MSTKCFDRCDFSTHNLTIRLRDRLPVYDDSDPVQTQFNFATIYLPDQIHVKWSRNVSFTNGAVPHRDQITFLEIILVWRDGQVLISWTHSKFSFLNCSYTIHLKRIHLLNMGMFFFEEIITSLYVPKTLVFVRLDLRSSEYLARVDSIMYQLRAPFLRWSSSVQTQ